MVVEPTYLQVEPKESADSFFATYTYYIYLLPTYSPVSDENLDRMIQSTWMWITAPRQLNSLY